MIYCFYFLQIAHIKIKIYTYHKLLIKTFNLLCKINKLGNLCGGTGGRDRLGKLASNNRNTAYYMTT